MFDENDLTLCKADIQVATQTEVYMHTRV